MSNVIPTALRLLVARHRATTAHLCSAYPFHAEAGLGARGVYLGTNVLTGGGGFAYDPFETYGRGVLTNPNMLIAGEPGVGKSATAKTFIYRSVGVFGRWVAIADPKGEYLPLAEALGLDVIKLSPGRSRSPQSARSRAGAAGGRPRRTRPAPDDDGRRAARFGAAPRPDPSRGRRARLGDRSPCSHRTPRHHPRRRRVGAWRSRRTTWRSSLAPMLARSRTASTPAIYGLGKLLDRSLRGMFDGPTTVHVDWSGPGIVLDLSAVHHDPEALTLVMIAATAWLQTVLARPDGPRRIQVLDEAWSLLGCRADDEIPAGLLEALPRVRRRQHRNRAPALRSAVPGRRRDGRIEGVDGPARRHPDPRAVPPVHRPGPRRDRSARADTTEARPAAPPGEGTRAVEGRRAARPWSPTSSGRRERWFCDTDARMAVVIFDRRPAGTPRPGSRHEGVGESPAGQLAFGAVIAFDRGKCLVLARSAGRIADLRWRSDARLGGSRRQRADSAFQRIGPSRAWHGRQVARSTLPGAIPYWACTDRCRDDRCSARRRRDAERFVVYLGVR